MLKSPKKDNYIVNMCNLSFYDINIHLFYFIENSKNQGGPKVLYFLGSNWPKKFSIFIKKFSIFQGKAARKVLY